MAKIKDITTVQCPGCPKTIEVDPAGHHPVPCRGCGRVWKVELRDAPGGRFVLRLTPGEG